MAEYVLMLRFVDVVGELAVTPSARFCQRVRKQPSGENDVQDGELKDWSDETSEWQYFEGTHVRYDTISIWMLFNKIRDKNDEGDFSDRRKKMSRL